jgi:UDP-N-acetylmuramyl pentapeptide phosphotransferase/UDP-N-acetylglucosamine-1-phosphate transferase
MLLGALCIGATLGFLVFNYPLGKLFLGDGGAYFLGFWVAEMAVLLVRHPEINAWKVLGICGYPVIEVMFSIYRRKFIKKVSPGAADALHLHTLIYRRVVFTVVPRNTQRPWLRNAAVSLYIVPVVACCVAASALLGDQVSTAVALVVAQLFVYVAAYRRLVHGRWSVSNLFTIGDSEEAPQQQ